MLLTNSMLVVTLTIVTACSSDGVETSTQDPVTTPAPPQDPISPQDSISQQDPVATSAPPQEQDPAPTQEPVATPTPTQEPIAIQEPTQEPTEVTEPIQDQEPTQEPVPTPAPIATPEPTPPEEPTASSEPTQEPEPTPTTEPIATPEPMQDQEPTQEPSATPDVPAFTNLETGEPVELIRAIWTPGDIEAKQLTCNWFEFNGTSYSQVGIRGSLHTPISHTPLTAAEPLVPAQSEIIVSRSSFRGTWSIVDGAYSGINNLERIRFVEVIERFIDGNDVSAVRFWMLDSHYYFCEAVAPQFTNFRPTGVPVAVIPDTTSTPAVLDESNVVQGAELNGNNNCDYTDAALSSGLGWDPVAGASCPPLTVEDIREAFSGASSLGPDELVGRQMFCQSLDSERNFILNVGFAFTSPFGASRFWLNTVNRFEPFFVHGFDILTTYEFFPDLFGTGSSRRFTDAFQFFDGNSPTFRDVLEFRFIEIGGRLMVERSAVFTSQSSPAADIVSFFACDSLQ